MAICKSFVGRKVIDGFKGTIDYYLHDGVQCARTWPRSQGRSQTPASVAQQPMFTYVQRLWKDVSPTVKESYKYLAWDCGLHQKDWFMRGYYGYIYRYPTEPTSS
jgi:hypothetical protein